MKTSFSMSAPIVWADGYIPVSGFSKMCTAIGRMLGGLVIDGARFKIDAQDFSLAFVQMVLTEAGVDKFVMGASFSVDGNSSFVAMTDGSVWRFECQAKAGKIHVDARQVDDNQEVAQECVNAVNMKDAIRNMALKLLAEEGQFTEGDTYIGRVVVDGHAAIVARPFAYGHLIINDKNGTEKYAWKFGIDAPRSQGNEITGQMYFMPLSDEEKVELKKVANSMAVQNLEGNPFPQKIGVA